MRISKPLLIAALTFLSVSSLLPQFSIANATPVSKPGKVTAIVLTPGNKTLSVSWSKGPGGTPTSYRTTINPGRRTISSVRSNCNFSNLLNGTVYTVSIVAVNSAGTSSPSVVSGTPLAISTSPSPSPSPTASPTGSPIQSITPAPLPDGWIRANGYLVGPGANLASANLSNTNLTGANLSNSNLNSANLSGANLTGANLDSATLSSANLQNTTLTEANLNSAKLSGANLTNATLINTIVDQTNFVGAKLQSITTRGLIGNPVNLPSEFGLAVGYLVGPQLTLPDANLTNANLASANLTGANLTGANLFGVNLFEATLTGAILTHASSGSITGEPKTLPNGWNLYNGYLLGAGANLLGANLSTPPPLDFGPDWKWRTPLKLAYANLEGANLGNLNLTDVDLWGANLKGAKQGYLGYPSGAPAGWKLIKNCFIGPGANISGCDLSGADLTDIDLTGVWTDTRQIQETNCGCWRGRFRGGSAGWTNSLPKGWKIINGYLLGPGANLSGAYLSGLSIVGANLTDVDLTGANLTGVKSAGLWGTPTLPRDWKLIGGILIGPGADLSGADLSGADLSGADLTGVKSGNVTGPIAALPTGWKLLNGFLVGPGADLSGAYFYFKDLSQIDLTGVKSGNVTGPIAALPTGWKLVNGYLVGPGSDLSGADLSGANLTNIDLTGANLTKADLTGAYLVGTKLNGVKSGSIIGTPAVLPDGWKLINGTLVGP